MNQVDNKAGDNLINSVPLMKILPDSLVIVCTCMIFVSLSSTTSSGFFKPTANSLYLNFVITFFIPSFSLIFF